EDDGRWRELVRTNDAVLVSAVGALLDAGYISHVVLDQNMSVLEGSIGILPRRILVNEFCVGEGRELLEDAGLGLELRPDVRGSDRGCRAWRQAAAQATERRTPVRPRRNPAGGGMSGARG